MTVKAIIELLKDQHSPEDLEDLEKNLTLMMVEREPLCRTCPKYQAPTCTAQTIPAHILFLPDCPNHYWPIHLKRQGIAAGANKIVFLQPPDQTPQPKLLGDHLTELLERSGIGRLSALYKQLTGKDCGCKSRREALNKLHAAMKNKT